MNIELPALSAHLLSPTAWMTWSIPVLLVGISALLLVGSILRAPARRERRAVQRLGVDSLNGVLVQDGVGGRTWVEHIVLRPEGILVLELKPYPGLIFAAEGMDRWTQVLGRSSFRFDNPLHKNRNDTLAVQAFAPKSPVAGRVVFTGESRFPKGLPPGVCLLEEFARELGAPAGAVPPALQEAWDRLKAAAAPAGALRGARSLAPRAGARARRGAVLLLALAGAWLAWRLAV